MKERWIMNLLTYDTEIKESYAALDVLFEQCDLYLKDARFQMYLEAGQTMGTTPNDPNVNQNQNQSFGSKIKNTFTKIIDWIKKIYHKFLSWIKNILSKMGFSFAKDHKKEVEEVEQHKELIDEIYHALQSGKFNPDVKAWPNYKLYTGKWENMRLSALVDQVFNAQGNVNMGDIERAYLPPFVFNQLQEAKATTSRPNSLGRVNEYWIGEAVNYDPNNENSEVKPIYVCFETCKPTDTHIQNVPFKKKGDTRKVGSRLEDWVWDKISEITKSNMLHAGIALDPSLKKTYTYHCSSPQTEPYHNKGGFRIQDFCKEYGDEKHKDVSGISIYVAFVSKEKYKIMQEYIDHIHKHAGDGKYNWGEIFARFLKKPNEVRDNDYSWVCSTFTNAVLTKAGADVAKVSDSPAPGDLGRSIVSSDDFECVYMGPASGYSERKVIELTKKFAGKHTTQTIHDKVDIIGQDIELLHKSTNQFTNSMIDYLLFDGGRITNKILNRLVPEAWINLKYNITDTGKFFESKLQEISEDNKETAKKLEVRISALEKKIYAMGNESAFGAVDIEKEYQPLRNALDRARVCLRFTNDISMKYNTACNTIMRTHFYKTSYKLYRDTVSVYEASKNKA